MNTTYENVLASMPLLLILAMTSTAETQIINIQPALIVTEENGLSGEVTASGDWNTGNTTKIAVLGKLSTRFRYDNNHVYLMASGRYIALDESSFEKNISEHLRYRYDWTNWFGSESFAQHEYNEFRRLLVRLLFGIGPRFTPFRSKIFDVALGTAYMLEYEQLDDAKDAEGVLLPDASETGLHHRWSNYLSLNLVIEDKWQLASTTYYQPRFEAFKDFRVLSELAVSMQIVQLFSLKISCAVSYDNRPAMTVKKFDSYMGFGLNLAFGPIWIKDSAPSPTDI
jgi:putative salt-induced outer membrane protein YdiY